MRTWLSAALIAVVTATGTASAAPAPSSTWWQGAYGQAPFYGRQIAANGGRVAGCDQKPLLATLGAGILFTQYTCSAATVSPANHPGGDFVTELAYCAGDESGSVNAWGEVSWQINDADTRQTVRHWSQPAPYQPSDDYTLRGGQCAFYLWHLAMVTDAGTPLASGHEYAVLFSFAGGEQATQLFVAP